MKALFYECDNGATQSLRMIYRVKGCIVNFLSIIM